MVRRKGCKKRKRKRNRKKGEKEKGEKWRIVRCAGRGLGCTVSRTRLSYAGIAITRFTAPTFWWRSTQGFFSAVPVSLSLPGKPVVQSSHRLTPSATTVPPIPTRISRKVIAMIIIIMIFVILLLSRMMMMEILVPMPTLVMKMTTKKTREGRRRRRRRRKERTRWFHGLAVLIRCHRRLLRALLRLVLVWPGSGGERVRLSTPMMRSVVLRLKCPLPRNYQTMIHLLGVSSGHGSTLELLSRANNILKMMSDEDTDVER